MRWARKEQYVSIPSACTTLHAFISKTDILQVCVAACMDTHISQLLLTPCTSVVFQKSQSSMYMPFILLAMMFINNFCAGAAYEMLTMHKKIRGAPDTHGKHTLLCSIQNAERFYISLHWILCCKTRCWLWGCLHKNTWRTRYASQQRQITVSKCRMLSVLILPCTCLCAAKTRCWLQKCLHVAHQTYQTADCFGIQNAWRFDTPLH